MRAKMAYKVVSQWYIYVLHGKKSWGKVFNIIENMHKHNIRERERETFYKVNTKEKLLKHILQSSWHLFLIKLPSYALKHNFFFHYHKKIQFPITIKLLYPKLLALAVVKPVYFILLLITSHPSNCEIMEPAYLAYNSYYQQLSPKKKRCLNSQYDITSYHIPFLASSYLSYAFNTISHYDP